LAGKQIKATLYLKLTILLILYSPLQILATVFCKPQCPLCNKEQKQKNLYNSHQRKSSLDNINSIQNSNIL